MVKVNWTVTGPGKPVGNLRTLLAACWVASGLVSVTVDNGIVAPKLVPKLAPGAVPIVTVELRASTDPNTIGAGLLGNADAGQFWVVPSNAMSYRPGCAGARSEVPLPQSCGP